MNHAWFSSVPPPQVSLNGVSAVPVLPATGTPGIAALVPVPSLTTPSIAVVSSAAVCASIGWLYWDGSRRLITRPSGSTTRLQICGFIRLPPLATAAATSAICSGVTSEALLADRDAGDVDRVVAAEQLPAFVDAARVDLVVGQVDRRGRVEAEAVHVFEQRVLADLFAELGEPGVDRVGQRRVERDRAEVLGEVVLQRLALDVEFAGRVDRRFRRDRAAVEAGGGGHHLEGRAGRVLALGGAVEQRRFDFVFVQLSRVRREPGWGRRAGSRRAP